MSNDDIVFKGKTDFFFKVIVLGDPAVGKKELLDKLVFDITRSSTFSNINNWYSSAMKYGLSGIPRILIGNNAHLTEERKIILPMAEHLAEKLNTPYYETSTLTGENIKNVFEKIAELVYIAPRRKSTSNNKLC